ncbi:MAG: serine hydrolase domain-containing protein, partial [Pseudomonadota bacterium]
MIAPFQGGASAVVSFLLKEGQAEFGLSGETGVGGDCAPEDVIFEIGSISKVFAGILLAVMVEEGRIDPDCPLGDVVPDLVGTQAWLTPHRLATHNAGLPKLHIPYWKALMFPTGDDPYADFSREDLFR